MVWYQYHYMPQKTDVYLTRWVLHLAVSKHISDPGCISLYKTHGESSERKVEVLILNSWDSWQKNKTLPWISYCEDLASFRRKDSGFLIQSCSQDIPELGILRTMHLWRQLFHFHHKNWTDFCLCFPTSSFSCILFWFVKCFSSVQPAWYSSSVPVLAPCILGNTHCEYSEIIVEYDNEIKVIRSFMCETIN